MRCLRKAVSKTRRDTIPNTKIREMVGTKSIHHHIQQQRIQWFGQLTRLPIQQKAQRAYNTKFSGRKARGRPPRRPGLTESKRHYICITSFLPSHSYVQQTNVSVFPRRPKWNKRQTKVNVSVFQFSMNRRFCPSAVFESQSKIQTSPWRVDHLCKSLFLVSCIELRRGKGQRGR